MVTDRGSGHSHKSKEYLLAQGAGTLPLLSALLSSTSEAITTVAQSKATSTWTIPTFLTWTQVGGSNQKFRELHQPPDSVIRLSLPDQESSCSEVRAERIQLSKIYMLLTQSLWLGIRDLEVLGPLRLDSTTRQILWVELRCTYLEDGMARTTSMTFTFLTWK